MGGRVRIEDAVPHGTRFCVTLPASGASSSRAA
jgi:signal transduction histidine kinase